MLSTALELDEGNVRVMLLTANEKHARCLEVIQQKRKTHVACWLRSEPDKSASLLGTLERDVGDALT